MNGRKGFFFSLVVALVVGSLLDGESSWRMWLTTEKRLATSTTSRGCRARVLPIAPGDGKLGEGVRGFSSNEGKVVTMDG